MGKLYTPHDPAQLLRETIETIDRELPWLRQLTHERGPGYQHDAWVDAHGYAEMACDDLFELWYRYNSLLAHLDARIPESAMHKWCIVNSTEITLRFVIEDHAIHMRHRVDHIPGRAEVTPYPPATVQSPFVSG